MSLGSRLHVRILLLLLQLCALEAISGCFTSLGVQNNVVQFSYHKNDNFFKIKTILFLFVAKKKMQKKNEFSMLSCHSEYQTIALLNNLMC